MRRMSLIVVIALLAGVSVFASAGPTVSGALQASPAAAAQPPVIASEVFAAAPAAPVDNPELALGRVTIMPGAAIPPHVHPGTQIGVIVQGELTYSVFSGDIAVQRAGSPGASPEVIQPGETVAIRVGDALIESPGAAHQGRNDGAVPVVIYLSTLFPAGAPRSTLVEATPAP